MNIAGMMAELLPIEMRRDCDALTIPHPSKLREATEQTEAVAGFLAGLPGRSEVVQAVLDALNAGDDPARADTVAAALHGYQLAQAVGSMITETCRANEQRAALDSFDEFVESARPVFEQSAAKLTEAHQALGDVDLNDPAAVLRTGRGAGAAFMDLETETPIVDRIRRQWVALARARRGDRPGLAYGCILNHDRERWITDPVNVDTRLIDLLRDGWRLELHSYAETVAFLDEVDTERRHRDQAERAQRQRQQYGMG